MNLKHFAVVTIGVYVGAVMIAPVLAPMMPNLPLNLGTYATIALGVILVDKFV